MRKYVKPVMVKDELQINQAIAACSGGKQGYTAIYKGWCILRAGGAPAAGNNGYASKEAALAVIAGWGNVSETDVCQYWEVVGPKQDGSNGHVAYYEDTNHNGQLDGGYVDGSGTSFIQGLDHWQSVESPKAPASTIFVS